MPFFMENWGGSNKKSEWSLSNLQCELIRGEKWAKYDVMRIRWPRLEHGELWPGSPWNEASHEDQYVLVREWGWGGHLPFCSLWDTIWWGIMMSVNPRRVKFYFQLPTIWGALCKQRPFQLWIPKLYWSLIIICIHKAIHERLLQAMR